MSRVIAAVLAVVGLVLLAPVGAVADGEHWAAPHQEFLFARHLWDRQLDAAALDQPVAPGEWTLLLSRSLFPGLAEEGVHGLLNQAMVSAYSGDLAVGGALERGRAMGGLAKLLGLAGRVPLLNLRAWPPPPFTDWGEYDAVHLPLVAVLVEQGLVQGYPGGRVHLAAPLTNGQALALVRRVVERWGPDPTPLAEPLPGRGQGRRKSAGEPPVPLRAILLTAYDVTETDG